MSRPEGLPKSGGREAGTPNKRTQELAERLEALGVDPAEGLARIAKDAEAEGDKALAAKCYGELMPYLWPRRKSVAISGDIDAAFKPVVHIRWADNKETTYENIKDIPTPQLIGIMNALRDKRDEVKTDDQG